jgi:adenylate kinase
MKIIIFGPPGSGKGTQAEALAKETNLKHIVFSDLLRREIKKKSLIGKKLKSLMEKGILVQDDIVNNILSKNIPKDNFILDGAPRSITQALFLKNIFEPDYIFVLKVPVEVLRKRLLKRSKIENRTDDNLKTINERFKIYNNQTKPLLKHYKIKIINGNRSVKEINEELIKIIKNGNRNFKVKS